MALFRLTLKSTHLVNGLCLEKGMSVEVASASSNPLLSNGSKAKGYLSSAYFEVKKVS